MDQRIRDYYRQPGTMTSIGDHKDVIDTVPGDLASIARFIQGVLLHEHWAPAYGQELSDERRADTHVRSAATMLDRAVAVDHSPLVEARPLERRVVGTCRNFTVLAVAILRAKGIPARARCGFATYFDPKSYVDHWVAEYWDEDQQRWKMVDAQIDEFQRERLTIDFDLHDVPRDRFLVAGVAWKRCRSNAARPYDFGIMDMRGLWFVAGNVIRDLAALNNMEMLPWDDWGAMPEPEDEINDDQLRVIDDLARITRDPDVHVQQLGDAYANEAFRVPPTVFNAVLNRPEQVV